LEDPADPRAREPRLLYDRLAVLIRSAYPYVGKIDQETKKLFFAGEYDSLGFVTAETDPYTETPSARAGFRWVKLALESNQLVLYEGLYYDPAVLEDDGEDMDILYRNVDSFVLEYYDRDEDEDEGEWVESWDTEDHDEKLPEAVRLTVKILADNGSPRTFGPHVVRIPLGGGRKKKD